jgi:Fe-S-cluster containining protein
MTGDAWYRDGLRFECTRCGRCCGGTSGTVLVSDAEIETLARRLDMKDAEFRRVYTVTRRGGDVSLRERANYDCVFFDTERGCTVYEDRPRQCRTYPFWESILHSRETWSEEAEYCEGIGRGEPAPAGRLLELARDDGTRTQRQQRRDKERDPRIGARDAQRAAGERSSES